VSNRTATYSVSEYVFKYKTQVRNGTLIDATGFLLLPRGLPIPGGHPTVLYGHGTVGINDADAPSATLNNPDFLVGLELNIIRNFAAIGCVVVVPDYAGFGVAGVPGYAYVKKPTAYSMIDAVRSAFVFGQKKGLDVSGDVALLGHSQGGAAVLHTLEVYDGPEAYGKNSFNIQIVVPSAPAPVWRYALYAAAVGFNPSLASIFATYAYSATMYNPNLNMGTLLTPLAVNITNTYVESVPLRDMIAYNVFPSNLAEYLSPIGLTATQYNLNGFLCYTGSLYCQGGLPPLTLSNMIIDPVPADWQAQMDDDSAAFSLTSR
jgi:pimeloyl-ACP methyl ester carboxylesterase